MARTKIGLTVIISAAAFAIACHNGDTPTEPADSCPMVAGIYGKAEIDPNGCNWGVGQLGVDFPVVVKQSGCRFSISLEGQYAQVTGTIFDTRGDFIFHIKFGSGFAGSADGRGAAGPNGYGLTGTWTGSATGCIPPDPCCTGTSGTFDLE